MADTKVYLIRSSCLTSQVSLSYLIILYISFLNVLKFCTLNQSMSPSKYLFNLLVNFQAYPRNISLWPVQWCDSTHSIWPQTQWDWLWLGCLLYIFHILPNFLFLLFGIYGPLSPHKMWDPTKWHSQKSSQQ